MNLFNHTKNQKSQIEDHKQFPIKKAILISGALSFMLGSNLEKVSQMINPTAQQLTNLTSKKSKLGLLPSPKKALNNIPDNTPDIEKNNKEKLAFNQTQLNSTLINNLEKIELLSEFKAFLVNLQQESQIIISFPQEDNINKEQKAQPFTGQNITLKNYDKFKLNIEKQVQTARLAKICGIEIEKYNFFERFDGINSNAKTDEKNKTHNSSIGGYAGNKNITSTVENFNPNSVLHEANHLDSLANNNLTIHEAIYGITKMLTIDSNWKEKLTPEKLIKLFEKYQEVAAKNPENYQFQGQDSAKNYIGTEFSSVETEKALQADSKKQLIQVLGQLAAIPGQEKFMSPEALDVFNFIRLQKGDIANSQQLFSLKEKINELEKVDIKNLKVDPEIQIEAKNFQDYLKIVDQILESSKNNITKAEENKIIIRNLLRMIFVSITLGTFFSFLTFISYPIIQKIENKLKE